MKIAFLVSSLNNPSTKFRVIQYIPYFEKQGWEVKVLIFPKNLQKRIHLFFSLKNFDIVILQKRLLTLLNWKLLKSNSKLIGFDFDDAVMFRDYLRKKQKSFIRKQKFARIVKGSDIILAGNHYLKNHAIKYNRNVFIVPTSIDVEKYRQRNYSKESDNRVTLGWIGSSSTVFYLERLKHIWDEAFNRYPNTRLKIVADNFFHCDKMPVTRKKWNYDEEISDLHSFDIGLMPLTDDLWSQGKCGFKLLQYMAVGIPVICSPVGINKKIVKPGINGFWAENENDWLDSLGKLIKDRALRETMGKEAFNTVNESYSLGAWAPRLISILENNISKC